MADEKQADDTTTNQPLDNDVQAVNNSMDQIVDPLAKQPAADAHVPAKGESDTGDGTDAKAEGEQEWSPDLLARAKELGLTIGECKELGSPESLTKVCDALQARAESPERGTPQRDKSEPATKKPERFNLKLDPEVVGSETAAALQQFIEHHEATKEALLEKIASLEASAKSNFDSARAQRIEGYFEKLQDFDHIIGPDHPRNRQKVIDEMEVLRTGYEATGRKAPPESELFQRAFNGLFGKEQAVVARREVTRKLEDRHKRTTARPDQTPAQLSARERARRTVEQFYASNPVAETVDIE